MALMKELVRQDPDLLEQELEKRMEHLCLWLSCFEMDQSRNHCLYRNIRKDKWAHSFSDCMNTSHDFHYLSHPRQRISEVRGMDGHNNDKNAKNSLICLNDYWSSSDTN
mgnify:CR=1 FL=1